MNGRRGFLIAVFVFQLAVSPLRLSAAEHQVKVTTIDHQSTVYALDEIQILDDKLVVTSSDNKSIPLSNVISLEFDHSKPYQIERLTQGVRLVNDDWLNVTPKRTQKNALLADWDLHSTVSIPLESIRYIGLKFPKNEDRRESFFRQIDVGQPGHDSVFNVYGIRQRGTFLSMNADDVVLQSAERELVLSRQETRAIAIDPELTFMPQSTGLKFLYLLPDGSHITCTKMKLIDDKLLLQAEFGSQLKLPVASLRDVRILGGRTTFLSDLKPKQSKMQPFFTMKRQWRKDRNILGLPIRSQGKPVVKGIGCTSLTELEYTLGREFQSFAADLELDAAAENDGHVTFSVLLDNQQVQTGVVSAKMNRVKIGPHDVSEGENLKLVVSFGERGDILDYVNWCYPVLIKKADIRDSPTVARPADEPN